MANYRFNVHETREVIRPTHGEPGRLAPGPILGSPYVWPALRHEVPRLLMYFLNRAKGGLPNVAFRVLVRPPGCLLKGLYTGKNKTHVAWGFMSVLGKRLYVAIELP